MPLSWSVGKGENSYRKIELFGTVWLALSEIASYENFEREIYSLIRNGKRIVIRGCGNNVFGGNLNKMGFKFYPVGSEGIIRTSRNLREKKSLRELIRRGIKHGDIKEYKLSEIDSAKLEDLMLNASHAEEPKLRNLYRIEIDDYSRIFILGSEERYLNAITISKNCGDKYQTELMLRRKNSPVGTMEALINYINERLYEEGIEYFSLGEVPFVIMQEELHDFIPLLTNKIGRGLRFSYNYRGLFNFKNKFMPEWEDVYLAAYPKLSIDMLMNIFFNSQLHKLVFYKLFNRLIINRTRITRIKHDLH